MTPSARSLRRQRVADLRQAEPRLSHREMAQRLGLSKDTVRRDLHAIERRAEQSAPPADGPAPGGADGADTVAQTAPQVSAGGAVQGAPQGEASAVPVAQGAPVAQLPRRVAQRLGPIDVSRAPALRRDLAVLAQSGGSPEVLVHLAVTALARHYRQALATGEIQPGQRFLVRGMTLTPLPGPAPRSAPPGPPPPEAA